MNITQIAAAIAFATGFAAGGIGAWQIKAHQILKIQSEAKDAIIIQQRNARTVADRLANQVITAQNAATTRATVLRRDAAGAANAGTGLRTSSTDSVRAAKADTGSCLASITQYDIVLSAVSRTAEGLAIAADAWESDAVMLHTILDQK
jgi:hypothetical protein